MHYRRNRHERHPLPTGKEAIVLSDIAIKSRQLPRMDPEPKEERQGFELDKIPDYIPLFRSDILNRKGNKRKSARNSTNDHSQYLLTMDRLVR